MNNILFNRIKDLLEITPEPQNKLHYQVFKVIEELGEFAQKVFKEEGSELDLYEESIDIYLAVIALIVKFDVKNEITEEIIRLKMEKWKKNLEKKKLEKK